MEQQFSEKKRKSILEEGMPDVLAIRYLFADPIMETAIGKSAARVLWIECKRVDKRGRLTKPTQAQKDWKLLERKRGALVWTLGVECDPSFDGFKALYEASGLQRR